MKERISSDSGLMGPSHALSSIAIIFLLTALFGEFMFNSILGSSDAILFFTVVIIAVGASVMPDLDASRSTSISVLGFVGVSLSKAMRAFSKMVQSTLRTKYDSKDPDPHRGFWHTILAAFLAGLLVFSLTSIKVQIFEVMGKPVNFSMLVVVFIIFMSIKLLTAALLKNIKQKQKKSMLINIVVNILSLGLAIGLTIASPSGQDFRWVAAAITLGWLCHLVGDMMTVAGVPILAPFIKVKGKRWWNFRFPLGIKAGGWVEMSILNPIFLVIAIICGIMVVPMLS